MNRNVLDEKSTRAGTAVDTRFFHGDRSKYYFL